TQRQTCLLFYCASGILGAIGLTVFGHRRILAVVIVLIIVVLSTAMGERLRASSRRIPVPFGQAMRELLVGRAARYETPVNSRRNVARRRSRHRGPGTIGNGVPGAVGPHCSGGRRAAGAGSGD